MTDVSPEELPRPTRSRWQPLRLGLVELFYYEDEQFWFDDGRLLLRGNNGTGKSKVLALTLPFVLDGSKLSRRVEPDADPKKRIEWNLLLDGALDQSERTGYSWVEFGRLTADGTEEFCTLGIGMKAAAGRGIVKTWYFATSRRIGDLRLIDENRIALTQERLRDELHATESGQLYTTQESYRRAVDEALFRLGEERYGALIDLLIQLRQPQLSRRPDEKSLSAALTEALAPLDQAVVADAAESFRSLEEERIGIADAKATLASTEAFLQHYRAYARVATRRRTTAVREANSRFEHAGRDLSAAQDELTAAGVERERVTAERLAAEEASEALQGREQALRESPEMRDAHRLDEAAVAAAEMDERAAAAENDERAAQEKAERENTARDQAERHHTETETTARSKRETAAQQAVQAGLAAEHETLLGDADAGRRVLVRRREQIQHVTGLLADAQQAQTRAQSRRTALDDAEADEAGRLDAQLAAGAELEQRAQDYRIAVRQHAAGLTELVLGTEVDELADRAEQWAHDPAGTSPVPAALDHAQTQVRSVVERERAAAQHDGELVAAELAETETQIAALQAGHDPEPPDRPGRDPRVREDARGAPLWRLVDFAEPLAESDRAGLEAALQSAGLLDAWVFPDGTVRADGDVVLGPSGAEATEALSGALLPVIGPEASERGLTDAAVAAVLDRIGLGAGTAELWVTVDGAWGAGPARGAFAKERAEYVGAGAREAHRHNMIATLSARCDELREDVERHRVRVAEAEERLARIRAEREDYPADAERAVLTAHAAAQAAAWEHQRSRDRVEQAHQAWQDAQTAAAETAAALAEQATELKLGETAAELDQARDAVQEYELALLEARTAVAAAQEAEARWREAGERAEEAAAELDKRRRSVQSLRAQAVKLRSTLEALRATVGASVAEMQERLAEVVGQQKELRARMDDLHGQLIEAERNQSRLVQRVDDLTAWREERDTERVANVAALQTFTGTGLLRIAVPEVSVPDQASSESWTVTAALALARAVEHELSTTDESDDAWLRMQQRVSTASNDLSGQMTRRGHMSFIEQKGDVMVARVRYLGEDVDIDQMAARLADDVAERERLLSARELEILENHLVNEVAWHLHELLSEAEGQIARMNRELADRKTSTGMRLRVTWRERGDGPTGLRAARELLARSDATWTPTDRTAIGEFLQARISEVRDADPSGSWQEHLERALDYRQWHVFGVERWQAGQWRSASGPASGGEKVLSVSIPLFAAASAHYNSADAAAPRLILLDEAFAGVDDDSRAKSLGLLATFDLDVVMTSEREWGCYAQVPGLSIAQLSRVEGVDAIGVSRWRWNGKQRERLTELGPANQTEPPEDERGQEGLFL